jgi:hypothetical protein
MGKVFRLWLAIAVFFVMSFTAYADEVTEWNLHLIEALRATNTAPMPATRAAAIVHAAIFDAVNGIERRYSPIHVEPAAERGASKRAAVIQAAYVTLVNLFPTQKVILNAKREVSLDALSGDRDDDRGASKTRGIAWGQTVADAILQWRSTDGFSQVLPPYLGGLNVGQWRPTPPALAPGAGQQFATMTPFMMPSSSYFRPGPPPALNSARYTADFNEVKSAGSLSSTTRTADQTLAAFFWNSTTSTYLWNTTAVSLLKSGHASLSENSRILALLNVAGADATIACWDAKYVYEYWRPITAIPLAATDGNPNTVEDPNWQPLFATPAHPEYPSGHSCSSAAFAAILARYFGESPRFNVDSDVMLGVRRTFRSFSQAVDEVKNARIWGGIHFRTACEVGEQIGINVARLVLEKSSGR